MLVLSRRPGEQIKIGDEIVITLVACEWGKARIGIDAPRRLSIVRTELLPLEERPPCQNSEKPTSNG